MSIEFSIAGHREVSHRLRGIAARAQDLRPAWPSVGDVVALAVERQFDSEGSEFGTPWKPLDAEYRRYKVEQGYSPRILVASGKMKRGLTSRPMAVERYERDSAEFGTDSQIAEYHQHGTSRGLPARPILVWTPALRRRAVDRLRRWVRSGDL